MKRNYFKLQSMWSSVSMLAFFALSLITGATASYLQMPDGIEKDKIIYEKYVELDQDIKKAFGSGLKMMLPFIMEANENLNLSTSCSSNLFQLLSGIRKLQLDAVKFLDASGKLPAGLMTGTFHMLGDYDECLNASILRKDGIVAFKGQYCLLNVRTILPKRKEVIKLDTGLVELLEYTKNASEALKFFLSTMHLFYDYPAKYGLCVPSGCSPEDINMMLHYLAERFPINGTVRYCDQQDEKPLPISMIISICVVSVFAALLAVGSFLDYYCMKKKTGFQSVIPRSLVCFSVFTNFPKLISTKISDNSLSSLFGIRCLSLFYVILCHQYFIEVIIQNHGHVLIYKEGIKTFFMQIIINGTLTVDIFFLVGGIVNSYVRTNIHQSGKYEPSVFQIIIHRLWRIYPAYILAALISFLFWNGKAPMATLFREELTVKCETEWWKNILFINNFFNLMDTCMPQGWYIAADMQLFLISLLTVPVLWKNVKKGVFLHIGVIAIGITGSTVWAWYKDIMPAAVLNRMDEKEIFRLSDAFCNTLPHIAPYFTGILFGYVLCRWKDLKISTTVQVIVWPIAATCFTSMLFITQKWNSGTEFTRIESALYYSFCRLLYPLAVAWLVVCCCTGHGGIINYILSLKIWIPIARLSFMMYLISPILQGQYHARMKMLHDTDNISRIWRYMGDLGVSGLMSLVLVIFIESPFISLEKIVFPDMLPPKKEDNGNQVEVQIKNNEDKLSNETELETKLNNITIKM